MDSRWAKYCAIMLAGALFGWAIARTPEGAQPDRRGAAPGLPAEDAPTVLGELVELGHGVLRERGRISLEAVGTDAAPVVLPIEAGVFALEASTARSVKYRVRRIVLSPGERSLMPVAPTEFEVRPGARISLQIPSRRPQLVRVFDLETGKPLHRARLSIAPSGATYSHAVPAEGDPVLFLPDGNDAPVFSNREGEAWLAPSWGVSRVVVQAADHASVCVPIAYGLVQPFDVALGAGGELRLTTAQLGLPTLELQVARSTSKVPSYVGSLGESGEAVLRGIPEGRWDVKIVAGNGIVLTSELATVRRGVTTEVHMVLPDLPAERRVVGTLNLPASWGAVEAVLTSTSTTGVLAGTSTSWIATVGPDGRRSFSMTLSDGSFRIAVSPTGTSHDLEVPIGASVPAWNEPDAVMAIVRIVDRASRVPLRCSRYSFAAIRDGEAVTCGLPLDAGADTDALRVRLPASTHIAFEADVPRYESAKMEFVTPSSPGDSASYEARVERGATVDVAVDLEGRAFDFADVVALPDLPGAKLWNSARVEGTRRFTLHPGRWTIRVGRPLGWNGPDSVDIDAAAGMRQEVRLSFHR